MQAAKTIKSTDMKTSRPIKTKFIVKERFSGTRQAQDIFSDMVLSEMLKNQGICWTSGQKSSKIMVPTIPNQIVPQERS